METRCRAYEEKLRRAEEEKREMEREIDLLRRSLAANEEERRAPTSPPDVEMKEDAPPSTPSETLIPVILRALEGWLEKKWDQMMSNRVLPHSRGQGAAVYRRQARFMS